jgi:hypothetical protein
MQRAASVGSADGLALSVCRVLSSWENGGDKLRSLHVLLENEYPAKLP